MSASFVILNCSRCGGSYTGRRRRPLSFCPSCRPKINLERMRRNRKDRAARLMVPTGSSDLPGLEEAVERRVIGLTVVHDPIDVGGFRPGTYFGHDDWVSMMKCWTFTPGTILKDMYGREYQVGDPTPSPSPNERASFPQDTLRYGEGSKSGAAGSETLAEQENKDE